MEVRAINDRINNNMYEANIKLVDENKYLQAENDILRGKVDRIGKYVTKVKKSVDEDNILYKYMDDIDYIVKEAE